MINIILYQPEIPANTGNILRTAMASNCVVHIIGPIGFTLDEKSLKRAGMDYIKKSHYKIYENYEDFLKIHKDKKIYYISRYGTNLYSDVNFDKVYEDYFIMFGKESCGIDKEILKNNKDNTLRIPMMSDARSLNLSNTVAIVIYEVLRQQKFANLSTLELVRKNII